MTIPTSTPMFPFLPAVASVVEPIRATPEDAAAEAAFVEKVSQFLDTSITYVVESLPVLDLTVDRKVQRAYLNKVLIAEIVEAPDFSVFGTFVVSRRADGTLHVVDGQHRKLAQQRLIELGRLPEDYAHPCRVFRDLTTEQEARLFTKLNRFTDPQPIERFRLLVEGADPESVAIFTLMKDHGWKPDMGNGDGNLRAISALQNAYRLSPYATARALDVLTKTWGPAPSSVNGHLISGFVAFLDRYGDQVDSVRLIERLQATSTATSFRGKAASFKESTPGMTHADAVATNLVRAYNFQLKTKGLPLWDAS